MTFDIKGHKIERWKWWFNYVDGFSRDCASTTRLKWVVNVQFCNFFFSFF